MRSGREGGRCGVVVLGPTLLYVVAAGVGALLAAGVVVAVRERSRLAVPVARLLRSALRLLPLRLRARVRRSAAKAATQLRSLLDDRDALRASAVWAMANWVFDAASLWVFLTAFGFVMDPVALVLVYSVATLLSVLPLSPGGLGLVEGSLIPGLLAFGAPGGVAVLGVVSWRLFEFWVPIPLAGLTYLSLRGQLWWQRRADSHRTVHSGRSQP